MSDDNRLWRHGVADQSIVLQVVASGEAVLIKHGAFVTYGNISGGRILFSGRQTRVDDGGHFSSMAKS